MHLQCVPRTKDLETGADKCYAHFALPGDGGEGGGCTRAANANLPHWMDGEFEWTQGDLDFLENQNLKTMTTGLEGNMTADCLRENQKNVKDYIQHLS